MREVVRFLQDSFLLQNQEGKVKVLVVVDAWAIPRK